MSHTSLKNTHIKFQKTDLLILQMYIIQVPKMQSSKTIFLKFVQLNLLLHEIMSMKTFMYII